MRQTAHASLVQSSVWRELSKSTLCALLYGHTLSYAPLSAAYHEKSACMRQLESLARARLKIDNCLAGSDKLLPYTKLERFAMIAFHQSRDIMMLPVCEECFSDKIDRYGQRCVALPPGLSVLGNLLKRPYMLLLYAH